MTPRRIPDQATLERAWRQLMDPLGFRTPQLWLLFLQGFRPRQLLRTSHVPLDPVCADLDRIGVLLERVLMRGESCAFLYARPGPAGQTERDLAWARGLTRISTGWPVHLANDDEVRVAAPDDLLLSG
jgi:hypothetical protein